MEFIFICPRTGGSFGSSDFEIADYQGIGIDSKGNKTLNATIALTRPCPYCGEKHSFSAAELTCPFGGV